MDDYKDDIAYKKLAMEIVYMAADDYFRALLRSGKHEGFYYDTTVKECEQFFRSQWFATLCDLDPDYLMERIKRRVFHKGKICRSKGKYDKYDSN